MFQYHYSFLLYFYILFLFDIFLYLNINFIYYDKMYKVYDSEIYNKTLLTYWPNIEYNKKHKVIHIVQKFNYTSM